MRRMSRQEQHQLAAPHSITSSARGSREAACTRTAGAELAAIDDAVVLVAGGAQHRRAGHAPVADLAVEEIADRAALVARGERELDLIAAEPATTGPSKWVER